MLKEPLERKDLPWLSNLRISPDIDFDEEHKTFNLS